LTSASKELTEANQSISVSSSWSQCTWISACTNTYIRNHSQQHTHRLLRVFSCSFLHSSGSTAPVNFSL